MSPEEVREFLEQHRKEISRLESHVLKPIEKSRMRLLKDFANGRIRSRSGQLSEVDKLLIREFLLLGPKAILSTGAMRAGDFLNNQLRGRWAEDVVASMRLSRFHMVPFGPSGAAMPGQEDHRRVIATFREIDMLEGKRPDLVAYGSDQWARLSQAELDRARTWPERLLDADDIAILCRSRFGIEVKSSTWHYGKRREHRATLDEDDAGPLSITVKHEELKKIVDWMHETNLPVLFFQVLFDEIYCMSFSRMVEGIRNGWVYTQGDYLRDELTGAGNKVYHRFLLRDARHLCAFVRFPDESEARVEVLVGGSVIPYVQLRPAQAYGEIEKVVVSELKAADEALKLGVPVLP